MSERGRSFKLTAPFGGPKSRASNLSFTHLAIQGLIQKASRGKDKDEELVSLPSSHTAATSLRRLSRNPQRLIHLLTRPAMTRFALPITALLAVSAFGFFSILHLFELNGTAQIIRDSVEAGFLFSDTGEPLRRDYTGFAPLDAFLCILVRFFHTSASGESPALSVFTIYFAGQVLATHTILVLEGAREGNVGTALY